MFFYLIYVDFNAKFGGNRCFQLLSGLGIFSLFDLDQCLSKPFKVL